MAKKIRLGLVREEKQANTNFLGVRLLAKIFSQVWFGEVHFALCSRNSTNGAGPVVDDSASMLNAWPSLSSWIGEFFVVCLARAAATPAGHDEVSWCNPPPEIETSTDRWLNRRNASCAASYRYGVSICTASWMGTSAIEVLRYGSSESIPNLALPFFN